MPTTEAGTYEVAEAGTVIMTTTNLQMSNLNLKVPEGDKVSTATYTVDGTMLTMTIHGESRVF